MKIIDTGCIFASRPGTKRQSCTFPSICVLPSGRWICGFRSAPTKSSTSEQTVLMSWSDDEGASWSKPYEPFSAPQIGSKPGRLRMFAPTVIGEGKLIAVLCWVDNSNPSLPFFNPRTQGLLDTKILMAFSEDSGQTWSELTLVDTHPYNQPTPITGPILVLPNGEWACQFELNKSYDDLSVWKHSSIMKFSRDAGQTWPEHVVTSNDPENRIFFWDQRPSVLDNKTLLDLFWTYDNSSGSYLNIHARESRDNGRTWSQMWDTGVPGQPAPAISLPGNRTAMVYVDRLGAPVIYLRISKDGGKTWPRETQLEISGLEACTCQTIRKATMQDAWSEMSAFSLGLPHTASLVNGDLLIVFYQGDHADHTGIEWVRVGL